MLQRNIRAGAGRRVHIAHAAVLGLHALCCGLPAIALAAVAFSGAASGVTLFALTTERLHLLLHAYEGWILGSSAALVALGGFLELSARRHGPVRAFPWLFALSVACFALNVLIVLAHRAA